jgi:hypothetical protein
MELGRKFVGKCGLIDYEEYPSSKVLIFISLHILTSKKENLKKIFSNPNQLVYDKINL